MSRHVSQNTEVAVVTRGLRQGGGKQSHDPVIKPWRRMPRTLFAQPQMHIMGGWRRKRGQEDETGSCDYDKVRL